MPFTAQSGAGEGGARGREVASVGDLGADTCCACFQLFVFFYKHFDLVIFFFYYLQDF